jgi:hypothetical protein
MIRFCTVTAVLVIAFHLLPISSVAEDRIVDLKINAFRNRECAFSYPINFRPNTKAYGTIIELTSTSRLPYWQDTIVIRKQSKEN